MKLLVVAAFLAVIAFPVHARAQQLSSARADQQSNVPQPVRQAEADVEDTFKRFRIGGRTGVTLDPELIMVGAHATFGPIFTRRALFRPSFEFAYGEVTTLAAINLDGIYRLTPTMRRGVWSPYVGGGAMLGFSHRGFSTQLDNGRSFDFGDFNFNGGVNVLAGFEKPSGVFIEVKATAYTIPHLSVSFGFSF